MAKNLATLCASLLLGCSSPANVNIDSPLRGTNILNGYEASYLDFPSIGAFVSNGGMYEICTVSFVKKDLAITAAHCIENGISSANLILFGYDEVFEEPHSDHLYSIAAGQAYPGSAAAKYSDNWLDIAVVLMKKEVPGVEPIPILKPSDFEPALRIGNIVTIAGYGAYEYEWPSVLADGKLYAADVPIIGYHNEDEILVGEKDPATGNACYGDSGGPVYVYAQGKVQLTGVASRIPEQTDNYWKCGYSLIYTLPGKKLDWIEDTYKELREKYPLEVSLEDRPTVAEEEEDPLDNSLPSDDNHDEDAGAGGRRESVNAPNPAIEYASGGSSCSLVPERKDNAGLLFPLVGLLYALRRRQQSV